MLSRALCTCAVFAMACACGTTEGTRDRPSVILVSIDTFRADRLGTAGYGREITPSIDALAADSIVFERCYAPSASTLSSHASILTSLLPIHHGASVPRATRLADGMTTLAEVLAGVGYRTASINGGLQLDRVWGLDRGFQVYESVHAVGAGADSLSGPENRLGAGVERALLWLDRVSAEPFFLFLHSYETHHPYTPTFDDLRRIVGDGAPLPRLVTVDRLFDLSFRGSPPREGELKGIEAAYDAEIVSADRAVGRLVEQLKARQLYDRSLIVLTSDHGEEFGEHGSIGMHAHSLFDELLHVPLVVKLPGSRYAGTRVPRQVRLLDVAPTVLRILDLPVPEQFIGRALVRPEAAGPSEDLPVVSYLDSKRSPVVWSVRTPHWKLYDGKLYDLEEDPAEREDVGRRHPSVVAALDAERRRLAAQRDLPAPAYASPEEDLAGRLRALGYVQ